MSLTGDNAQNPRPAHALDAYGIEANAYELVPLDMARRTIARRLTESYQSAPHFPIVVHVEADPLIAERQRLNAELAGSDTKISLNDMIVKASAVALRLEPGANVSFTPQGVARHRNVDIAVAVATPGGLVAPIVRAADTKDLATIARAIRDLARRAQSKQLKPAEYQGGTFSVSNLGMYGVSSFGSILNPPHGCILSVGATERRPVVRGDAIEPATLMTLTLTCDHRAVDGASGAKFLRALKQTLERPSDLRR